MTHPAFAQPALAQGRSAVVGMRPDERGAHSRTLAQLGFANGISLDGLNVERVVSFRLPAHAPIDSATLNLFVRFSRAAIGESNLQVFSADVRLGVITRAAADSGGVAVLRIAVPRKLLTGDYLSLSIRSAVGTGRDKCLDQRLALSYIEIDPKSSFTYFAAPGAIATIRQAWAVLRDTVTLSLPARRLTADEFRAAFTVGIAAENEGRTVRYARLPVVGDITIATAADLAAASGMIAPPRSGANVSIYRHGPDSAHASVGIALDAQHGATGAAILEPHWLPLASAPALRVNAAAPKLTTTPDDPTLADLGITDLQRDVGGEAEWRIPLDLRAMPAGRVPSRVEVRLVAAPNTNDRQIVFFAFLNGTLVRSADVTESGSQQLIEVRLPSSLLNTRNELRLVVQRHLPASDACTQLDYPLPAQILASSRVYTTEADKKARAFTAITSRLSPQDPILLPQHALDDPAAYLPFLVSLGRAFWYPERAPSPVFYDANAAEPSGTFVMIGRAPSAKLEAPLSADSGRFTIRRKTSDAPMLDIADLRQWSVAQIVTWNSHVGLQVIPGAAGAKLPDVPDAYGSGSLLLANADSSVFQLSPAGRDAGLLFNDGPSLLERIRGDWVLWSVFGLLLLGPPIVLAVRAILKRTPRRQLRRGFDRNPTDRPSA